MHPILVLVGLLVGAQVAGLWGALFGIPILAVGNVFFNYAVNLRTIEETAVDEVEDVLEEVRQGSPDANPEELAALAADRVEEEADVEAAASGKAGEPGVAGAAEAMGSASGDLRAAAGDLREAAGEQRTAAGEIGESAADLRGVVDELAGDRPKNQPRDR
jgi:hypothetical protein